jgi:peptidoglycan hydrolase-like amidase
MVAEPAILEIDGVSGSPGTAYNQYLRDVVPLEIGVTLGSQDYKPVSAVEAQAIAARTYIYQRILYANQYGTPNNSNQFQVFVPYYYDTLTSLQKIIVQAATSNRHYLSEASNANPIEALFGADNPGVTSPGNRSLSQKRH